MTVDELVDKVWQEHDHDHDVNFLYSDGWTDACNRFHNELQGKSIIEWHKTSDELPEAFESIWFCFLDEFGKLKKKVNYTFGWYDDFDNYFAYDEDEHIDVNKVIAWTYLPRYSEIEKE